MTRGFTRDQVPDSAARDVEDAPSRLRHEVVAAIFGLLGDHGLAHLEKEVYQRCCYTLGIPAINSRPYNSTWSYYLGREMDKVEWNRAYDMIIEARAVIGRPEPSGAYRDDQTNDRLLEDYDGRIEAILRGHRIAWRFSEGRFERVVPAPQRQMVDQLNIALASFTTASRYYEEAWAAFNAIPRDSEHAAKRAFDCLESVVKTTAFGGDVEQNMKAGIAELRRMRGCDKGGKFRLFARNCG